MLRRGLIICICLRIEFTPEWNKTEKLPMTIEELEHGIPDTEKKEKIKGKRNENIRKV
jgi:hypothetical protein